MCILSKLTCSESPLHSLENLFAHERLIYIITDYPFGFVLVTTAAVADRLRHPLVVDTFPNVFLVSKKIVQAGAGELVPKFCPVTS